MHKKIVVLGSILIVVLFLLAACSQANPEGAVQAFMDNLIAGNYETAATFADGDIQTTLNVNNDSAASEKTARLILSKISYKIKAASATGDTATIDTEITAPNLTQIVGQVIASAMPMAFASAFSPDANSTQQAVDQFIEQSLISLLSSPEVPMTTTTIKIQLKKAEATWKVVIDDALANAITGGAIKAFEGFSKTSN